jgi:anaerobic magnesium-protoporphyrin IX monomethyl ester cyclase
MKAIIVSPYYPNIWEPIGVGYIVSYCKKNFQGDLDFQTFQGNFDSDDVIIAEGIKCDVVGFSCTSPTFAPGLRLAKKIKELNPNVRTVFGGWHITALGEKCLEPGMDQIVLGEGEMAFLDILNGNTDKVVRGTKMGFQDLPWPDRTIMKNIRTVELCESMNGRRTASFQGNRVCPVSCVFCSEKIMTGRFNRATNPIRSRDAVDICDEVENAVKLLNLNYFKFVDATFDISEKFVVDFCEEKIRRGLNTEWEALIHASFVTEKMIEMLKKSNCNQINVGCESGSPKILAQVGKGVKVEVIKKVFKWAKDYGINRRSFFILGMPEETREDLKLTEDLIDEIQPDFVGFTILCPYPGSSLYIHDKHKDIPWEKTDEYSNDFWETKHFTNAELKENQKYMVEKYKHIMCERQSIEQTPVSQ